MENDKKIEIDFTTIDGIRAGLKEIKEMKEHTSSVKLEAETIMNMLDKYETECIKALMYPEAYPHQKSIFYVPAKFVW